MKKLFYGNPVALNFKSPAGGGAPETVRVQLSPVGEFTLRDGGPMSGTVQRCTRAAFEAMVENWRRAGAPDILVDVDHASASGVSTEAAAWCNALEATDEGLFGVFSLTRAGASSSGAAATASSRPDGRSPRTGRPFRSARWRSPTDPISP